MIWYFVIAMAVVAADLISKWLVVTNIPLNNSVTVIPQVLRLTHTHNEGAAFGSLADKRYVFIILSTVMIAFLVYFIIRCKGYTKTVYLCASFILGGGIGNMVDRITLGYVVDFVDFIAFPFWKWIFNVADSFICIGVIIFAVYIIFFDSKVMAKGFKSVLYDSKKKETDSKVNGNEE